MPRARHHAAPAARARSLRLPALALVTLLGVGAVGAGPQAADGSTELAPTSASPDAERSSTTASRSFERTPLERETPPPAPEPAPTPTVIPAPEPAPAVEPAPEPVPAVTGQLWTTEAVNVRTGPSADAAQITTVPASTLVDVTGASQDGWSQVVWEGAAAWLNASYLSESEPQAAPAPAPAAAPAPASSGAAGTSSAACPVSSGIESGLQSNARAVYRSVCATFPGVSAYGGVRPGDSGDHGTGRAVDIMISGEAGWDIARYVQANAGSLGVTYVIYEQKIWMAGDPAGAWSAMEDRGGATANHFDHVHVSTR
ncbi:SH3 domain-containing protein [Cellulosimicrobium cellulans]|uniref:SH3 domain-containing protein n=1 Tax=Cellulosimicrobium cellulans TaxID=1710 RepID=UPI000848744C|nr:SH3 domain-containing protein [Cellulosimicrobium cellulans]